MGNKEAAEILIVESCSMKNVMIFVLNGFHERLHVLTFHYNLLQEKEIRRFGGTVPNVTATGDIESMAMYAGQGVCLINEILPASEVVKRLVNGAQQLILKEFSSL